MLGIFVLADHVSGKWKLAWIAMLLLGLSKVWRIILGLSNEYLFLFYGVLMVSWSGHGVLRKRGCMKLELAMASQIK